MVMMMVMDVVMMMMVVMVFDRRFCVHRSGSGGRAGRCFLGDRISGEAERKHGRGREGLDHGRSFLSLANPRGSQQPIEVAA